MAEFATHAAVALTEIDVLQDTRDQAERLRTAMTSSRGAIEQAKPIVTERHEVTVDAALRLLTEASMRSNREVRALAEQLGPTGELSP